MSLLPEGPFCARDVTSSRERALPPLKAMTVGLLSPAQPARSGLPVLAADMSRRALPALLVLLLGFTLRIILLDKQSLWSDEYITLVRASLSLDDLLAQMPIEHTPLYFVLLHLWFAVAGSGDFTLRFPSALWGTLSVALVYALGRRVFGPRVALVGMLLLAVNPFQVWYAQDARMYTQLAALSLAALLALDVALVRLDAPDSGWGSVWPWLAYSALAALALYTHYYAVIGLTIAALYAVGRLLARREYDSRGWLAFLAAQAGMGLLFLPWLPRALRLLDFPGWREPVTTTPWQLAGIYTFGVTVVANAAPWLNLLAVALLALGLASLAFNHHLDSRSTSHAPRATWLSPAFLLSAAALIVPAGVVLALLLRKPDFHPRYFIAATPVYSLLLAQAVVALGRWWAPLGAGALVALLLASALSLNLWFTNAAYAKAHYKDYMLGILAQAGDNDALLLQGPSQFLARRYGSDNLARTVNLQGSRLRDRPQAEIEQTLAEVAAEHSPVWLAVELPQTPGYVKTWLDTHGYQMDVDGAGDISLWAYTFPRAMPAPRPPQSIDGPAPVDLAWGMSLNPARPGDIVALDLTWTPTAPVSPNLKVSLRLQGPDGQTIWQRDRVPVDGVMPSDGWRTGQPVADRYAFRLPGDLAPGQYTWRVLLYDGASLAEQRAAELGSFQVTP